MQINLDRFAYGFKDPQDKITYDYCSYCKYSIEYGDSFLESPQGDKIHDEMECVVGFYQLQRVWAGEGIV